MADQTYTAAEMRKEAARVYPDNWLEGLMLTQAADTLDKVEQMREFLESAPIADDIYAKFTELFPEIKESACHVFRSQR